MNRLDSMDPETHPAGSVLPEDFGTVRPTPLKRDVNSVSEFYRIAENNTLTASAVPGEKAKDGGAPCSGRDSFETVVGDVQEKEFEESLPFLIRAF